MDRRGGATTAGHAIYLIMENANGGELFDYIVKHQRVAEPEACRFFRQIVDGVGYVGRHAIPSTDPEPILAPRQWPRRRQGVCVRGAAVRC